MWPKLSETLPGPRSPRQCSSCGVGAEDAELTVWRECDDADRPTSTVIVLCPPCAGRIIEPHPRLYQATDISRGEPHPGAMPTCDDCSHRRGLVCGSPLLTANGGAGLPLRYPEPIRGFACRRGGGGGAFTSWRGPVECKGKEEAVTRPAAS